MSYYENVFLHDIQDLFESCKWPMPCDGDKQALFYPCEEDEE